MSYWIGAGGDYIGPAATKKAFLAQGYGYAAGPFRTAAAAQAWLNGHPGGKTPAAPKSGGCGWFMVPPSIWQQILRGILSLGQPPSFEIAVARYACGSQAAALRNNGYQQFTSKAAAEASAAQANQNANTPGWQQQLQQLLSALGQPRTWLRVAEVLAGAVLVIIGIAQMAGRGPQTITALAQTARKVIP